MSNLLAAIKAREADIGDVRVEVVGALADSPARFAESSCVLQKIIPTGVAS